MLTALNALLERLQNFLTRTKDKLDEQSTLKNRALVYAGVLVVIVLGIAIAV
tara:strand:- start:1468 stop:1623 length:156 start_codon:yes stop_codon:yes gene_type:complete